ncbi:MAG: FHA domain-containing protein [Ardenticatenaceae bacterium]|nr:FHA domain-containing protein [Anaerolineales bacterium]MCB8938327.1 FHA domain-containing protein [Ardenticatenaceae bacterium]MCB8975366.1 FHA domain-containing protein [Ardenticatenaceae bacterium]
MMQTRKSGLLRFILLLAMVLLTGTAVLAQETPGVAQLFITDSDVGSLPSVELHIYGRDAQGNPFNLSQETLAIEQNGSTVGLIEYQGTKTVGTFTVFLFDIPSGVVDELPLMQDAITTYASTGNMMEQVDSVAVYQVGAAEAEQVLEPTSFYNSVRNLFATPLTPENGATALIDSSTNLLDEMVALKPNPAMAVSLVLMTDGTDVVSTRFEEDDLVNRALELGIPIHTIWLDNSDISTPDIGQDFLAGVAAQTGGIAVQLDNAADLPLVWNRITSFRDQARIRYTVAALEAGSFPVTVALASNPTVSAETTVEIPNNLPSVVINLPSESRTLALPNLDEAVKMQFSTAVTWLDGVERQLTAAQLRVNGVSYDVPLEEIANFQADITSLTYGNNSVEMVVMDEQGIQATSPIIVLTVNEGARQIPDDLDAGSGLLGLVLRFLLVVFALIVVVAVLIWLLRNGRVPQMGSLIPRGPSRPREPFAEQQATFTPSHTVAYLEVLGAVSQLSSPIPLSLAVVRIGRSPNQANIAFENDVTMSRLHASLMLEGNHYRLFDEQSTSGTWVNERQVPEYGIQLNDGDEIHLGAVHLRFRQG